MKKLLYLLTLVPALCQAQIPIELGKLNFDTRIVNAVNNWAVMFPVTVKGDSISYYGYIYRDKKTGFKFRFESQIEYRNDKTYVIAQIDLNGDEFQVSDRLHPVAVLSPEQVRAIGLPKRPEWMRQYIIDDDTASVKYLKDLGFALSKAEACDLSLPILQRAYAMQPQYPGLALELAYAYDYLGQHDKSIPVLEKALEYNGKDSRLYRQLGHAYRCSGQIEKMEKTYKKGISMMDNYKLEFELIFNFAHAYYMLNDKKQFDKWAKKARSYTKLGLGPKPLEMLQQFEDELNKRIKTTP